MKSEDHYLPITTTIRLALATVVGNSRNVKILSLKPTEFFSSQNSPETSDQEVLVIHNINLLFITWTRKRYNYHSSNSFITEQWTHKDITMNYLQLRY